MIKVEIKPVEVDETQWYDTEKTVKIFGITVFKKRLYTPRMPEALKKKGYEYNIQYHLMT